MASARRVGVNGKAAPPVCPEHYSSLPGRDILPGREFETVLQDSITTRGSMARPLVEFEMDRPTGPAAAPDNQYRGVYSTGKLRPTPESLRFNRLRRLRRFEQRQRDRRWRLTLAASDTDISNSVSVREAKRAFEMSGLSTASVGERVTPMIGAHELLLRPDAVGICASDFELLR